tara:strand:- start:498 stop:1157 length:660 start_codon:yes stop_codon:yes gene_type:complete
MEMPDYSKGVIYKITTPNGLYVGSTCNFDDRVAEHRSNLHNENSNAHNFKLYQHIRENSGVWEMKKIKDFPCENDIELRQEEDRIMLELNASLNIHRAYLTEDEKKEYLKNYYEEHKEHYKEYRKANKEQRKKYYKEYRKANKEKLNERDKKYYEANKEKNSERCKKYREANKEQIKAKRREKINCECGCLVIRKYITGHRKTKKHLDLILKNNVIINE